MHIHPSPAPTLCHMLIRIAIERAEKSTESEDINRRIIIMQKFRGNTAKNKSTKREILPNFRKIFKNQHDHFTSQRENNYLSKYIHIKNLQAVFIRLGIGLEKHSFFSFFLNFLTLIHLPFPTSTLSHHPH